MVAAGIALLLLGATWTLYIHLIEAWPSFLPWGMMVVGLLMTAIGCGRKSARAAKTAWGLLAAFVAVVLTLWALG